MRNHLLHFSSENVAGGVKFQGICYTFPAKTWQVEHYKKMLCF